MTELSPLPIISRRMKKLTAKTDLTYMLKVTISGRETDYGIFYRVSCAEP
jgi:hypothetical protein